MKLTGQMVQNWSTGNRSVLKVTYETSNDTKTSFRSKAAPKTQPNLAAAVQIDCECIGREMWSYLWGCSFTGVNHAKPIGQLKTDASGLS